MDEEIKITFDRTDANRLVVLNWAMESGYACPCGGIWEDGGVDDSGKQAGASSGPGVWWWSGWIECERRRRMPCADASD